MWRIFYNKTQAIYVTSNVYGVGAHLQNKSLVVAQSGETLCGCNIYILVYLFKVCVRSFREIEHKMHVATQTHIHIYVLYSIQSLIAESPTIFYVTLWNPINTTITTTTHMEQVCALYDVMLCSRVGAQKHFPSNVCVHTHTHTIGKLWLGHTQMSSFSRSWRTITINS